MPGAGEHLALLAVDPTGISAFPIPEGATWTIEREGTVNVLTFISNGAVVRRATFETASEPAWTQTVMADAPSPNVPLGGASTASTTACGNSGSGTYCATTIVNPTTVYHQMELNNVNYNAYYLYSCDFWYSCTNHLETRWHSTGQYVSSHCVAHVGTQTVYSLVQPWGGTAVTDSGTYIWAGRSC